MRPALTSDKYILVVYIMNLPYSIHQYPSSIHQVLVTSVPFSPIPNLTLPTPSPKLPLCKFVEKKNMPHLFKSHLGHVEKCPTTLLSELTITHMDYYPHLLGQWPPSCTPPRVFLHPRWWSPDFWTTINSITTHPSPITHHPSPITHLPNHLTSHLQNRRDDDLQVPHPSPI